MNPCDASEIRRSLALRARDLLRTLAAPALAPFLTDWPDLGAERRTPDLAASDLSSGTGLPVLRWLAACAAEDGFAVALIGDIRRHVTSMDWRQTYPADSVGRDFLQNYGYSELLGPTGPLAAARIACGFLVLGPRTLYPRHSHEAEEIYVPLSGTARWQRSDSEWVERVPGTVIYHASEEPHAMHTGDRPLLAIYVWRGALNRHARLEAEGST